MEVTVARTEGRVDDHQRHLETINGSVERLVGEVRGVRERLTAIETAAAVATAAANIAAEAASAAAAKQVTTRTFALGIITVLISLAALYLGAR